MRLCKLLHYCLGVYDSFKDSIMQAISQYILTMGCFCTVKTACALIFGAAYAVLRDKKEATLIG